jgi:outer membrane protein TolC
MLRITVLESRRSATLKLEGKIGNEWVNEMEKAWLGVVEHMPGCKLVADLTDVSFVDEPGRQLLRRMSAAGVRMTGSGPMIGAVIREIEDRKRTIADKAIRSALAFFLLLIASVARGQEILTLDQAVTLAVAANRQVNNAQLEAKKLEIQLEVAKLKRLPSVSTELYASGLLSPISFEFQQGSLGNFPATGPIPDKDTKITTGRTFNLFAVAGVKQPLSQLYKIGLGINSQKMAVEAGNERIRAQRIEIAAKVRSLYYEILRMQSALKAGEAAVSAYREMDRLVNTLLAERTVLRSDSLEVRARLLDEQQKNLTLRHGIQSTKEQLNVLMARPPETAFEVEAVPAAEVSELDLAQSRVRALAQRPEMRLEAVNVRLAENARKIQKADSIPDVGAFVQYFSPFQINFVPKNIVTAGIQVTWEPFDWGRRRREAEDRRLALEQAQNRQREIEAQIVAEVGMRFRKLESERMKLEVAQLAQEAAQERVRVVTVKYGEQAALLRDVLDQQTRLAGAQHQYQDALLSFWTAKADLRKALGDE